MRSPARAPLWRLAEDVGVDPHCHLGPVTQRLGTSVTEYPASIKRKA
jgi:hypothetical protein